MSANEMVAVPVRGAGCIIIIQYEEEQSYSCCPREGHGLHPEPTRTMKQFSRRCCPREGHGLHRKGDQPMINTILGCCPREGHGLHP